jgi:hypothetical protein
LRWAVSMTCGMPWTECTVQCKYSSSTTYKWPQLYISGQNKHTNLSETDLYLHNKMGIIF